MPPRWSPATTTPSSSYGRPSIAAAATTSPSCRACRIADEDTPGTVSTSRTAKPSRSSSSRSPRRREPKRKSAPAATASAPIARRYRSANTSGSSAISSVVNDATSVASTPAAAEQLQPPLERRDQFDVVPERDPRVRVERDHRRCETRVDRRLDDAPMAPMDAVERPDRDRPRLALELGREWAIFIGSDVSLPVLARIAPLPARSPVRRPADRPRGPVRLAVSLARSAGPPPSARCGRAPPRAADTRSASASSTENGPTSVRRSATQWPPSASAIDRT